MSIVVPDDARREVARAWADAVAHVGYTTEDLHDAVLPLVDRIAATLRGTGNPATVGRAVGWELVAAQVTSWPGLESTLDVLVRHLPALWPERVERDDGGRPRIARLIGGLAAGFATACEERLLDEQESAHRAALEAGRRAEESLAAVESRFQTVFDEAALGIGIADLEGNLVDFNPTLLRMFGYSRERFAELNVTGLVHPEDAPAVAAAYKALVAEEREHFSVEKRFFRADGEMIWTNLTISLIQGDPALGHGRLQLALVEDVTERHRLLDRLEHQAFHDPLTGLPNSALFADRLARVYGVPAHERRVGLLHIDLDGFKTVNDTLGHDVGDRLLVEMARRLCACCGPGKLAARMGGDEFVVLIEDTTGSHQVRALAERILAALTPPVLLDAHELRVTASIGVVERRVDAGTALELQQAADITLYWAKGDGRNRYALFDPWRNAADIARFTLSAGMSEAVARDEFFVDYQPLVSLTDGSLRGVEALVRWQHPEYGLLGPNRFIELAEQTGVIVALGRWTLRRACEQARRWRDEFGDATPVVSVNLAPRQLREGDLVGDVATLLAETGLEPGALQLELTEQSLLGDTGDDRRPVEALEALYEMGVRIAIDDFGTGYSNLAYLRKLPVHDLKLDASFVEGLRAPEDGPEPVDARIVATLVALAHALGLTVTAEGVETPAQRARLEALHCDTAQGWLFAKAGPPEEIEHMLRAGGGPWVQLRCTSNRRRRLRRTAGGCG